MDTKEITTTTQEETQALAKSLIEHIFYTNVVLLSGDLGAGKTTFMKGLAQGLKIPLTIKSPTYTYVNEYLFEHPLSNTDWKLYHFDLYRLPEVPTDPVQTAAEIGLSEALERKNSLVVIEWPERLPMPSEVVSLNFTKRKTDHLIRIESPYNAQHSNRQ